MLTKKIKELEATRARAAALEKSIAKQLNKSLSSLPSEYGFDSIDEFIRAVRAAVGGGGRRRRGGRRRGPGRPKGRSGGKKRFRAVITDATRNQVKAMVDAGKTGAAIAKSLKISLPSVQNIKKALGLVKARK